MDATQKQLLKNEITIQLSKAKITIDNLKQVKQEEREEFINIKLLEVNDASLRWALQKHVISENELKTNKFFTNNKMLKEHILNGAFATAGIGASGIVFTTATAPVFLGFGGGIGAIGLASAATIAAPVVLSGIAIFGVIKYRQNQELEELEKYFETEKRKILNFYLDKIDGLKLLEK